jgi:hypothetical protein
MTERNTAPKVQIKDLTAFEYVMAILVDTSLGGVSGVARFFFFFWRPGPVITMAIPKRNCELLRNYFLKFLHPTRYFNVCCCPSQWQLIYWDCGFESRRGHGCLSLMSVVR